MDFVAQSEASLVSCSIDITPPLTNQELLLSCLKSRGLHVMNSQDNQQPQSITSIQLESCVDPIFTFSFEDAFWLFSVEIHSYVHLLISNVVCGWFGAGQVVYSQFI